MCALAPPNRRLKALDAGAGENENDNDPAFLTARRREYTHSRCPRTRSSSPACRTHAMPFRFITKSIHTYLILSCCHRLDGRANSAEARQEQSCRAVAFGGDPRHGTAAAGSHGPPGGARPGHPLLAASLGDRALGVVSITAPSAFHFTGLDAWYYWVLAAAVLLTTSVLSAPEVSAAQRANLDTRTAM